MDYRMIYFSFSWRFLGISIGANFAFGNYEKLIKSKDWAMIDIGIIIIIILRGYSIN